MEPAYLREFDAFFYTTICVSGMDDLFLRVYCLRKLFPDKLEETPSWRSQRNAIPTVGAPRASIGIA